MHEDGEAVHRASLLEQKQMTPKELSQYRSDIRKLRDSLRGATLTETERDIIFGELVAVMDMINCATLPLHLPRGQEGRGARRPEESCLVSPAAH